MSGEHTTVASVDDLRTATRCLYIAVDACVADDVKAKADRVIAQHTAMLGALKDARQTILDLKNARWSECEGTDEEWVAEIDAAISLATGASNA